MTGEVRDVCFCIEKHNQPFGLSLFLKKKIEGMPLDRDIRLGKI